MSASRSISGPSGQDSASSCPASGQDCPGGMVGPAGKRVAVQVPVGEVELRSLDVYELAAVGGAR